MRPNTAYSKKEKKIFFFTFIWPAELENKRKKIDRKKIDIDNVTFNKWIMNGWVFGTIKWVVHGISCLRLWMVELKVIIRWNNETVVLESSGYTGLRFLFFAYYF